MKNNLRKKVVGALTLGKSTLNICIVLINATFLGKFKKIKNREKYFEGLTVSYSRRYNLT